MMKTVVTVDSLDVGVGDVELDESDVLEVLWVGEPAVGEQPGGEALRLGGSHADPGPLLRYSHAIHEMNGVRRGEPSSRHSQKIKLKNKKIKKKMKFNQAPPVRSQHHLVYQGGGSGGGGTHGKSSLRGSTSANCGYTADTWSQKDESQGSITASDLPVARQLVRVANSSISSPSKLAQCE